MNRVSPLIPAGAPCARARPRWRMFAGRDEDLRAGDLVAAVRLFHRLGAREPEIGAAMRLGQVHGAGPFAGGHRRQVKLLLFRRAVMQQRRDRALGQPRIHRKRDVRAAEDFVDHHGERAGQALPAIFGRHRDAHPAAVGVLPVGILEAGRRGHAAVVMTLAAFEVADAIERGEHLLGELSGFLEDRRKHVGRGIGEARQIAVALHVKHVVQQELHVIHGRLVGRHPNPPRSILFAMPISAGTT
jgi:hypothetical protein